jgi:endonuclease/exonuclease/phosphatase family metal-dependent hydrolase
MRVVNWNIERRGPTKWQAASIAREIAGLEPDLVVLTEAHIGSLGSLGGHVLADRGYNAHRKADSERLILIWSPSPWEAIPLPQHLQENGGAVLGRTQISGRDVFCLGICIPWHMSPDVPVSDKITPWAQHVRFLSMLQPVLESATGLGPLIVAGDFNRFIPRMRGPKQRYELLETVFSNTRIVTSGLLPPLNLRTIDHVALSGPLSARSVSALSRFETDGRSRSDHFGVMVDLDWTPPTPQPD